MGFLRALRRLASRVRFGADPRRCPPGTLVVLPTGGVVLRCGIAALVEVARGSAPAPAPDAAEGDVATVLAAGFDAVAARGVDAAARAAYAGGDAALARLTEWARGLKRPGTFPALVADADCRARVAQHATRLRGFAEAEERRLAAADLAQADLESFSARLLRVLDVAWHVEREALALVDEVQTLAGGAHGGAAALVSLRRLALVLRAIDRIEIRGRDSAGVAVQVAFDDDAAHAAFLAAVHAVGGDDALGARGAQPDLPALSIVHRPPAAGGPGASVTFVYKVAAEVGRLGDNGAELRRQVRGDALLRAALDVAATRVVVLGHTRWASSGVISVPNCHPVDNAAYASDEAAHAGPGDARRGRVFVVMNGDVDNHLALRAEYEDETGRRVSPRVTTDTKVVALEIERGLAAGHDVLEAFRRAAARFEGSCALGMVTDLAPGRLFLSLRGSGQSLYVGVSPDGFVASSEVYGLVEETAQYVKIDGETQRRAGDPGSAGQVAAVGADGPSGVAGITRLGMDGEALPVAAGDVRTAEITTRDVDRGAFQHFFRKEITQSTRSVARTLLGRVSRGPDGEARLAHDLLPAAARERLAEGRVRRIYVVGQGTAAIAGAGICEHVRRVLRADGLRIESLPATELSGFHLADDMSDTIVVAVTQSGSTADTNRALDLVRRRGALVIAVVNRRNSDVTYRADGVVYTSDGRDVEMSVASTKAFYAQVVAGALLALAMAEARGDADARTVARALEELLALPALMQRVLDDEESVRRAAERFAPTREHWAVVASGPSHVAARELRIKLSELCYKSIAVDTVEDKKHIDLSSEPMTLVLAAGLPEAVLNDVVKDVAIFRAHKGVPVVLCSAGETRFDPYACAVVHLPPAPPLSSMLLSALAGHLFGYHAARAIDEGARFLSGVRSTLVGALEDSSERASLPQRLLPARREYLELLQRGRFTASLHPVTAVRVALLLDRTTGVAVPGPDDAALFDGDGTDLVAALVNALGDALDQTARPIDAIKHQAKIVTVGTSRPEDELPELFARALRDAGAPRDALAPVDVLELARIAPAVAAIEGLSLYEVRDLRPDGTPGPDTRIRITSRHGVASRLRSRLEDWGALAGTKRHVAAERRLFVGVGRGDGSRILIVPLLADGPGVRGLALLHVTFAKDLARDAKERLLGPRLDVLRDALAEANRTFDAAQLDALAPEALVLESPEDLAERLLAGGTR